MLIVTHCNQWYQMRGCGWFIKCLELKEFVFYWESSWIDQFINFNGWKRVRFSQGIKTGQDGSTCIDHFIHWISWLMKCFVLKREHFFRVANLDNPFYKHVITCNNMYMFNAVDSFSNSMWIRKPMKTFSWPKQAMRKSAWKGTQLSAVFVWATSSSATRCFGAGQGRAAFFIFKKNQTFQELLPTIWYFHMSKYGVPLSSKPRLHFYCSWSSGGPAFGSWWNNLWAHGCSSRNHF